MDQVCMTFVTSSGTPHHFCHHHHLSYPQTLPCFYPLITLTLMASSREVHTPLRPVVQCSHSHRTSGVHHATVCQNIGSEIASSASCSAPLPSAHPVSFWHFTYHHFSGPAIVSSTVSSAGTFAYLYPNSPATPSA